MTKSSIRRQREPARRFAIAALCVNRSRTISDFGRLRARAALAISENNPSVTFTVRVFIRGEYYYYGIIAIPSDARHARSLPGEVIYSPGKLRRSQTAATGNGCPANTRSSALP